MSRSDEAVPRRSEAAAELDAAEHRHAEEEQSLSAATIHETIRREGEKELERSTSGLAWSGLAGGLAMGMSLVGEGLIQSHLPDAPWRPLVSKLGFTAGFVIVILASQQLFTENTLRPIVPLLTRKSGEMLRNVARLSAVVLLANLLGTFLFATVIATTDAFGPEATRAFEEISRRTVAPGPGLVLLRGIFAGWLVALMVWMLPAASAARLWVIVGITYLIGIGDLSHVISGSADVFFLAARGAIPVWEGLLEFTLPTLIGNTIGGVALVAGVNHAQVTGAPRP